MQMNRERGSFVIGAMALFTVCLTAVFFLIQTQNALTNVTSERDSLQAERDSLDAEKEELQELLDREKQIRDSYWDHYYATTTYRDSESVIVNGQEWKFVHECVGVPKLEDGFIRCLEGESSLRVIPPLRDEVVIARSDQEYPAHRSYLRNVNLHGDEARARAFISYGSYGELEGRNELSGSIEDAHYNYIFDFNDQSIRKINNFPLDQFAQGPVWNNVGTRMAYVPVFCHPGCVPVSMVVYDLTEDHLKYFQGRGAYGIQSDLEHAIYEISSGEAYWTSIDWIDRDTVRGMLVEDGIEKVVLWDTTDPEQTDVADQ